MRPRQARSVPSTAARIHTAPSMASPQEDGTLTAVDGDTLIMFVMKWDRDGKLSSQSIHQFGSATLDVDVAALTPTRRRCS